MVKALGKGSVASLVEAVLRIASWLLWIGLAALIVAAVVYAAVYIMIGAGWIDASVLTGDDGRQVHIGGDGASLQFSDLGGATWPVVVPAFVIGAVFLVGALIIVGRLRRLFVSFTSGEPFQRENATHLRVIWITMLAMEIGRYVLLAGAAALLAAVGPPDGADADITIGVDFSNWLSIAVLFVLAEVFREGARLKEEQELTI